MEKMALSVLILGASVFYSYKNNRQERLNQGIFLIFQ